MSDLKVTHQSVHDYIAARRRGDRVETDRIKREVIARYESRSTDGTELLQLGQAAERVAFGEGR
jgi:hypothetical protein